MIDAVAVVVPAHDEEELLAACLSSIDVAARELTGIRTLVVVVLDACTDGSAGIAAAHDVDVVEIDVANVGAARSAGIDRAMEIFAGVPLTRLWTAHTDADSVVPPDWLTHQLMLAARGADAVVGNVHPHLDDLDETRRRAWLSLHTPGRANGAVHGANLGMRASTLVSADGFDPIAEHEDVRLVERARRNGARIVATESSVLTSGRTWGRTPGGYARYLREDLLTASAPADS